MCHVVLSDRTVSRLHGYLFLGENGSIGFEDAGSTGGSYLVDGEGLLDPDGLELKANDVLMLGGLSISVADLLEMAGTGISSGSARGSGQAGHFGAETTDHRTTGVSRSSRVRRDPRTGAIVRDE